MTGTLLLRAAALLALFEALACAVGVAACGRHGTLVAGALLAACAGLAVVLPDSEPALFLAAAVAMGAVVGFVVRRGKGLAVALGAGLVPVVAVAVFGLASGGPERSWDGLRREIEALGTAGADSSWAVGESPEDLRRRETARAAVAAVSRWAVRLLPASVVAACVLQVLPVVVVVARAARRRGFGVGVPPFAEWALPFASIWLLAAGLALVAAHSEVGGAVGANLVALYALGAAVQGVAVLVALHRRSPYPGVRIALWIVATLLLGPFLPGALALLGTADLWFDFRRPRATEGP